MESESGEGDPVHTHTFDERPVRVNIVRVAQTLAVILLSVVVWRILR
jgi:hypothetical protein